MVLRAFTRPECVTPNEMVRHHSAGWPSDLLHQLAVAMDVPVAVLGSMISAGGPVLVAAARGVSVGRVKREVDQK